MEGRQCGLSGCAEFGVGPDTEVEGWKVHSGVTSTRLPSHHSTVMGDSCGSCEPCGGRSELSRGTKLSETNGCGTLGARSFPCAAIMRLFSSVLVLRLTQAPDYVQMRCSNRGLEKSMVWALVRIKLLYGPCACQTGAPAQAPPGPAGAWISPAMHRAPIDSSSRRNWNWNGNSQKATLRPLCSGRRTRRATAANPQQRRDPSPLRRAGQVTALFCWFDFFFFGRVSGSSSANLTGWSGCSGRLLNQAPHDRRQGSAHLPHSCSWDASSLLLHAESTTAIGHDRYPWISVCSAAISTICLKHLPVFDVAVNHHSGSLNRTSSFPPHPSTHTGPPL